jgi:hypothetical protein
MIEIANFWKNAMNNPRPDLSEDENMPRTKAESTSFGMTGVDPMRS